MRARRTARGAPITAGSAARDRCCYLPREVFFGRLGFAGVFFSVWASDFERFLPTTSDSFRLTCSQAPYLRSFMRSWARETEWPR
jgi:hypothetical protein